MSLNTQKTSSSAFPGAEKTAWSLSASAKLTWKNWAALCNQRDGMVAYNRMMAVVDKSNANDRPAKTA